MSTEPDQRYIIKRVDGFVSVCDTLDNDAPIDNSANGLEALLNALWTASQQASMKRIHDLNQMGGLCEENARLKAEVERLEGDNQQLQARCNFLEDKPSYE